MGPKTRCVHVRERGLMGYELEVEDAFYVEAFSRDGEALRVFVDDHGLADLLTLLNKLGIWYPV